MLNYEVKCYTENVVI